MTESDYKADSIQVLEGLEAVRKRPGMYLGDPHDGSALHHCIWEVVDNAVDEHLAGYCDSVEIILQKDASVTIVDHGRGIPARGGGRAQGVYCWPYTTESFWDSEQPDIRSSHREHRRLVYFA